MKKEKSCGAIVYREKDGVEILLIKHKNGGHWAFPKGHVENKETEEETALREIREETGLTLTDYRLRGIVTFVSQGWETEYMFLYTATGWTGELLADCDEGTLEWVDKKKLGDLPIWKGDELFFCQIEDPNSPFFSLKLSYRGDELVYAALDGKELAL